jgi:N-acetylgalactosamine-6-sulfatase
MTGQFPGRLGVHHVISSAAVNKKTGCIPFLDPKTPTITRLLKESGYVTGHFGKWHMGDVSGAPSPGDYGIDEHRTVVSVRGAPTWEDANAPDAKPKSTTQIVDETIGFITANRDKPFYVNVWTRLPHAPLNPTAEQLKPYANLVPDPKLPYLGAMQFYLASVTDIDTQVGRLLAEIRALGLEKNTLVAFSSDNGPEFIETRSNRHCGAGSSGPFRGHKRSLYEGGVRVPFIVRWPDGGVPAGRVSDAVLAAVDWVPTICSLAGIQPPAEATRDGENVPDILSGARRERRKPLFWEWRFPITGHVISRSPMAAIRDGKWKLFMNPDRSRVELYDIPADPSEMLNVAAQHPAEVERLAKQLAQWQAVLPKGPVDPRAGQADYPWPKPTK